MPASGPFMWTLIRDSGGRICALAGIRALSGRIAEGDAAGKPAQLTLMFMVPDRVGAAFGNTIFSTPLR